MVEILNKLYNRFPRQIGIPYRYTFNDYSQFYNFINRKKFHHRIYASLYNYTGDDVTDKKNLMVDKIFFDLDNDKCFENVKLLHEKAMENNYKHCIFFSGGGFHFYIFTKNYEKLKNKKDALFNAQQFIAKNTGLKIGEAHEYDLDEKIIGDIARIATVPFTYNHKRKRFCIGVSEEMLNTSYKDIKEKAKQQIFKSYVYGTDLFDISKFDTERPIHIKEFEITKDLQIEIDSDSMLKELPPCAINWLKQPHVGYKKRGYIIMLLRDKGYLLEETEEFLKRHLQPAEFIHCCTRQFAPGYNEPGENQHVYLYNNRKTVFPNCSTLKFLGECVCPDKEKCKEVDFYK